MRSGTPRRIGYFGGTFDPPHRGHLRVALEAANAFYLDKVLLAPTGVQPLKSAPAAAPYRDRLAMTRLMCRADARLEASELDAPHPDGAPNYTIDALTRLQQQFPEAELFCVAGADSFLTIRQWRNPEALLSRAEWIVVSRPDFELDDLASLNLAPAEHERVHLLTTLDDDTSATEIRERLRVGVSPGERLTPEVMLYIARLHLYHPKR